MESRQNSALRSPHTNISEYATILSWMLSTINVQNRSLYAS